MRPDVRRSPSWPRRAHASGITIGARTLVGAGAAILKDTEPDTVWGPPAAVRFRKRSGDVNL